jgi:hypothetical protein
LVRVLPPVEADPEPEHPVRTSGIVARTATAPTTARILRDGERNLGFIA